MIGTPPKREYEDSGRLQDTAFKPSVLEDHPVHIGDRSVPCRTISLIGLSA
jgi:hypothetical protein